MAVGSAKVDPPGVEEDGGVRTTFPLTQHSADQETATDQPVIKPESGSANPNATGKY